MAELVFWGTNIAPASIATQVALPGAKNRWPSGYFAGEDIKAGMACYLAADGKLYKSLATTTATDATNRVDGYAACDALAGQHLTLYWDVTFGYAIAVVVGKSYFLSATNAGGLSDTATSGQTRVLGVGGRDGMILVNRSW